MGSTCEFGRGEQNLEGQKSQKFGAISDKSTFSGDYISALGVQAPEIFTCAKD